MPPRTPWARSWWASWPPAVSGFAAIWGMLRYLQTHNYDIFVLYRLIVALAWSCC